VPYLFVGGRPVGGLAEMRALSVTGVLEHVVRGEI
jgi:glutaredoxin